MKVCTHESATGVDQTDLNDDAKVWRCDACGFTYRNVITSTVDDEFVVRQPVSVCWRCGGNRAIMLALAPCPDCLNTGWAVDR